ncbi:hypothetical protein OS493_020850 [Desmophyllum pertusum]|uniref:Uncharacterized protein n=1 Tax=Desmophyllum pertusum TaxID=174260 RepID=A0A9W9YB77_9CNID|nr:hypothetical protein OS493_020850 [Desmophyllum pertusum]
MKMHNAFYQHLLRSAELYAGSLLRICAMFDGGDYAMGKCEWLNIFPGRFDLTQPGQLNLWGNEEDLFVSRMYAELETVYTTTCLSPHCPFGVKQVQSKAITLSNPGFPPPRFLPESFNQWLNTDLNSTRCGQRMPTVPPGAMHFLGNCIVQDPLTGQLLQTVQAYCGGMRTCPKRAFCNGTPPFLLVSLDVFARQAIITDASQLPQDVDILNRS